jgi:hypothetical protein
MRHLSGILSMRHVLVTLALCAAASSPGFADCPAEEETITAFGRTFPAGGLFGTLTKKDCVDNHKQPEWLATINTAPAKNGTAPGLAYCRQIASSQETQLEAKRRDCIYWYGHSIEVP